MGNGLEPSIKEFTGTLSGEIGIELYEERTGEHGTIIRVLLSLNKNQPGQEHI